MTFIQSAGVTQLIEPAWQPWTVGPLRTSVRLYDQFNYDYATLYRTQPNVRTCIDFLARNIAQLGLHTFRRISDTDRERLSDYPLARLIKNPLPAQFKVTRYRLIEALMSDLGIYFNAYWLKIRRDESYGLLRLPPMFVEPLGGLIPTGYEVNIGGRMETFAPDDVVHFRGYNPENAGSGLSPLETLRRILAEEHAAGNYREGFWQNSARMNGVIERPIEAPEWSETARARFRAEFEELYSGEAGSGKTAVLEEGMSWKAAAFNPQQSEYLGGRKLTREECARAYHIPLPLVGILDHATFTNVREQHKHLYQDTLGPWLTMIEEDIELQLLPEFADNQDVYVEFNIREKMAGDFEEQTQALQSAVGRPWMTVDEARARMNLPSMGGDAEQLVTPLNVLVGGQASPRDPLKGIYSAPPPEQVRAELIGEKIDHKRFNSYAPQLRQQHITQWTRGLSRHYRRQAAAIVSRVPKGTTPAPQKIDLGGVWWDTDRWNSELYEDLLKLNRLTALAWAQRLAEQMDIEVSEDAMLPWLMEHSRIQAEGINSRMQQAVVEALREEDPPSAVRGAFDVALSAWSISQAVTAVTTASNFGANEAANAGQLAQKTWRVNSGDPRDSHATMDGLTIPIDSTFPTGQRWPGDPAGGAANNANCQCSVEFS